ncbi:hypothetical protein KY360_06345 [Candidatus Woesearchaeota archaeon]|nr:hypothetical protein [Candidatus Woesearchaeota archaeon]
MSKDLGLTTGKGKLTERARERGISLVVPDSAEKITSPDGEEIKSVLVIGQYLFTGPRMGVYLINGSLDGIVVYGDDLQQTRHNVVIPPTHYTLRDIDRGESLRGTVTRNPRLTLERLHEGNTVYDSIAHYLRDVDNPFDEDPNVKASLCLKTLELVGQEPGHGIYEPETPSRPVLEGMDKKPGPSQVLVTVYADTEEGRKTRADDIESAAYSAARPLKPGQQIIAGDRMCDLSQLCAASSPMVSASSGLEPATDPRNQANGSFYWALTEQQRARMPFVPEVDAQTFRAKVNYVASLFGRVDSGLAGRENKERRYLARDAVARSTVMDLSGK